MIWILKPGDNAGFNAVFIVASEELVGARALRDKWNYFRVLVNLELLWPGVKVIWGFPGATWGWWDELGPGEPSVCAGCPQTQPNRALHTLGGSHIKYKWGENYLNQV